MDLNIEDLLRSLRNAAGGAFPEGFSSTDEAGRSASLSALLRPVDPFNRWPFVAPIVGVAGAAALLALSGVAIAAFAVMMAALAMVGFLLTQVFGYELALNPNARF